MAIFRSLMLTLVLCGATVVWAQEELTTEEASPVEEPAAEAPAAEEGSEAPAPSDEDLDPVDDPYQVNISTESIFPDREERSIAEEISIDLIDLDELREASEVRTPREVMRMSLEEAIQFALFSNPDILVTELEPLMSEADIMSAKGEFDPFWQTTANYLRASVAASQQEAVFGGISSIEQYQTTIDSTLTQRLHTGTSLAATFNLNKEESTFGGFIEEFETRAVMTLTQPLLRGFGLKLNRVRITTARNSKLITEAQLELTTMNVISEVVRAYWDLVGAVEALRVRQASLANAERLLKVNDTRREIGTAADIEVLSAKGGVATRQSELIAARAQVDLASDRLKQVLDVRDGEFFSKARIFPTDRPNVGDFSIFDVENYQVSLDRSVELALENRPELDIAQLQIDNAELETYRARNEMLPQFDLTANYGRGGRDHKLRQSLRGIKDKDQYFYGYGFQATVPIRNRTARGQYTRAQLMEKQAERQEQKTRTDLMFTVHTAARNVLTNKVLVESNKQAVRLQEAEVAAEESRLRLGVTTSWQLLQIEEQLTAAQTQLLQSQVEYEKALLELQLAEGTLLDNLDIAVRVPEGEEPIGYFRSIVPHW
jgi:outer membrane protein TolC